MSKEHLEDNQEIIAKINSLFLEAEELKHNENARSVQLADDAKKLSEEIDFERGKFQHLIISGYSHFLKEDLDSAAHDFQSALDYFNIINDEHNIAVLNQHLGQIDYKKGDIKAGLQKFYKALEIQTDLENELQIAHLYTNIGSMFKEIAEYGKAFDYYQKAITIFKKLNDKEALTKAYDNLAIVHLKLRNFEEAYKIRMELLKDIDSIKSTRVKMTLYANIGLILTFLDRFEEAYTYYDKAIDLSKELDDTNTQARLLNNIAAMKRQKGEIGEALETFHRIEQIFLKQNDFSNYCNVIMNVANIYKEKGMHDKAKEYYMKCEEISLKNNYVDKLRDLYFNIADLNSNARDHEGALEYYKKYMELQNKIYVDNVKAQLEHLEVVHQIDNLQAEADFAKQKNLELDAINKSLEEKNNNLNILISEKNEFISIATHDLRNPLNNVIGLSQLLREDNEKVLDPDSLENLNYVIESSTQMLKIIENIFGEKSLSTGTIEPNLSDVSLNALIDELVKLYHFKAEQKRISLIYNKPGDDVVISSDSFILHQIIDNILSNAIKFSPFDKLIELNLSLENACVIISIKDEGPGFSDDDKEKIFKKNSKLSAKPTAGESSSGLGLSIVKKLSDVINADITINSKHGKGAEFVITIKRT